MAFMIAVFLRELQWLHERAVADADAKYVFYFIFLVMSNFLAL